MWNSRRPAHSAAGGSAHCGLGNTAEPAGTQAKGQKNQDTLPQLALSHLCDPGRVFRSAAWGRGLLG